MRRKETSLLVESWKNFINESEKSEKEEYSKQVNEHYGEGKTLRMNFAYAVLNHLGGRGFISTYADGDRMLDEPIMIGRDTMLRDGCNIRDILNTCDIVGSVDSFDDDAEVLNRCVDACEQAYHDKISSRSGH